jgi:tagatose-1,6-bisphosphate aldolase non-catalytic subunit AgaZ/GatZ
MDFRKIKKITFALVLALSFTGAPGLLSLSTVQAQEPRPQQRGREQLEKVTMEERGAFRDGYRKGWQDSRAGRRYNYSRSRLYNMGDREYREMFRRGYARGYRRERVR